MMKTALCLMFALVLCEVAAQNCADPGELPNGGRVPLPSSPDGYAPGEELFYFCNDGYAIEDKACITCGGASGWLPQSSAEPSCVSNTTARKHVPDPHNCKCNIATGFFTCSSGPTPPPAPTPAPLETFDCKLDPAGGLKCEVAQGKSGDYNSSSKCEARCHAPTISNCTMKGCTPAMPCLGTDGRCYDFTKIDCAARQFTWCDLCPPGKHIDVVGVDGDDGRRYV
jgi:hypothetical protein